jgi:acyl-coenzyme A synthetase/AMP-(fatty) acid ligase
VVFDGAIQAFMVLAEGCTADSVTATLSGQLAAYKRPRVLHQLPDMPRTATGKVVRDRAVLRAHAGLGPAAPPACRRPTPRRGP